MNKITLRYFAFLFLVAFIAGCTSSRDKDANNINSIEEELKAKEVRPEAAELNKLLEAYIAFADKYPGDTAAPLYLYRAVNLSMGMGNGETAIKIIDRSINEYPKNPHMPEVIFLKAYVNENLMQNLGQASTFYKEFLKLYPEHELADDANTALENLGKTPEEMIKEFESRNSQAGN